MSIRILIADDHIMFTDMLQHTLATQPEQYTVVGVASDGETALELTLSQRPDLLLLDYEMPKLGRLASFCQDLLRQSPETRILVIGSHTEEEYAVEAAVGLARDECVPVAVTSRQERLTERRRRAPRGV